MQGPSLAKARPRLLERRDVELVRVNEATVRGLIASADVMSEGGVQDDAGVPTWFGSTSLVLAVNEDRERVASVVSRDLHARARILRVARREASLRAPRPLGPVRCEVLVRATAQALRIDVEVQAPLIERRSHARQLV